MKIDSVEAIPVTLPFEHQRVWATGSLLETESVLISIRTTDGATGWGEAVARVYAYGETQRGIVDIVENRLGPRLLNKSIFDYDQIESAKTSVAFAFSAKAAVDCAIWDLRAQASALPLRALLGGSTCNLVPRTWTMRMDSVGAMTSEAERCAEEGFRSFKVKVGGNLENDLTVLRALRKLVGPTVLIYADANQGFSLQEAKRACREFVDEGVSLVEDPISLYDFTGRREIRMQTGIGLIADESAKAPHEVVNEIDGRASDVVSIKAARSGITDSLEIAQICRRKHCGMLIGTQAGGLISETYSAILYAALAPYQSCPMEASPKLKFDVIEDRNSCYHAGHMALNELPGLGISPDLGLIQKARC